MKVILYGTGSLCQIIVRRLKYCDIDIVAFTDSDYNKHGSTFCEKEIISPYKIKEYNYDKIIIASSFFDEIKEFLLTLDINTENIISYTEFVKDEILKYYNLNERKLNNDLELKEVINYINNKSNNLRTFCYKFCDDYLNRNIEILKDKSVDMYYVNYENKKMYFKKSLNTKSKVLEYYNSISIEQDINSPHRYLTENFNVDSNSVIMDIGVGDGNFTLSVIDKIKQAYLFESDKEWIEALNLTFKPYANKVKIIEAFVSNKNENDNITLDSYIFEENIDFIKIDAEGSEKLILDGAINLLKKNKIKMVICVYHKKEDAYILNNILKTLDFKTNFSKGYMFFFDDDESYVEPYFRKGLIRAMNYE